MRDALAAWQLLCGTPRCGKVRALPGASAIPTKAPLSLNQSSGISASFSKHFLHVALTSLSSRAFFWNLVESEGAVDRQSFV